MRRLDRSYVAGGLAAVVAVGGLVAATWPAHASGAAATSTAAPSTDGAGVEPVVAGAGSARLGALTVTDAYVPQPASDDVAAAYFTVANAAPRGDVLLRASADVSTDVGLHDETVRDGAGVMVPLASIAIPAHGTMALAPDHRHVMIMNPSRPLRAGDHVRMMLTFARAGAVIVEVPVVPFSATLGSGDTGGMTGMSGMGPG